MQRLLSHSGLGPAALPISMAAAALVGLLLLATMGLSLRDWREIGVGAGRGASRIAALTGRGSVAASWILGRLLRGWSRSRFPGTPAIDATSHASELRRPAVVTPLPNNREPRLAHGLNRPANGERDRGGLVRFIAPKARPLAQGRRAEQERQPALDLEPGAQPVLPSLELLAKPQAVRTETIDEEALEKNARLLATVLEDFGVRGQIVQVRPGPVVTLYELEPAPGKIDPLLRVAGRNFNKTTGDGILVAEGQRPVYCNLLSTRGKEGNSDSIVRSRLSRGIGLAT